MPINKLLTEKQRQVLEDFQLLENTFPDENGIPPKWVAIMNQLPETTPLYGSIKALLKKGYIEKVEGENRLKVRYKIINQNNHEF